MKHSLSISLLFLLSKVNINYFLYEEVWKFEVPVSGINTKYMLFLLRLYTKSIDKRCYKVYIAISYFFVYSFGAHVATGPISIGEHNPHLCVAVGDHYERD